MLDEVCRGRGVGMSAGRGVRRRRGGSMRGEGDGRKVELEGMVAHSVFYIVGRECQ